MTEFGRRVACRLAIQPRKRSGLAPQARCLCYVARRKLARFDRRSLVVTVPCRCILQPQMGNTFGQLFRVTTFGASHGAGIGMVADGCPPRITLASAELQPELYRQ